MVLDTHDYPDKGILDPQHMSDMAINAVTDPTPFTRCVGL